VAINAKKQAKTEVTIDAKGVYYKDLNERIQEVLADGAGEITLINVNGQRYIGNGIRSKAKIVIEGVPGNDLAAFMDGLTLIVKSNAQDGVCNTMNDGKVVIWGDAGDVLGYGMRGGKLFIKGNVGYRVGIHMKEYKSQIPVIIVGGTARDFLCEYMAGGIAVLLGLGSSDDSQLVGDFVGTGMHGGILYIRGKVDERTLGKEVAPFELDDKDRLILKKHLKEYCEEFGLDIKEIMKKEFTKLIPYSHRPYGKIYAY
jgi:glutamate synthase domain-containing protein 3